MNRQKRILVVDDDPNWTGILSLMLESEGFKVASASSIEQAKFRMKEDFYHLLLLDIAMTEDKDNEEGMTWLAELDDLGLTKAVAVVMITSRGTSTRMRMAFSRHQVADFLDKHDFKDGREFFEVVSRVFKDKVQTNLSLELYWQHVKKEDVVGNLDIGGKRVRRNPELHQRLTDELDDLLCRLFNNAESLIIEQLDSGHGKGAVLKVQPSLGTAGVGQAVIVKFGEASLIDREEYNFKEYVENFVGGGRSTHIKGVRRTQLLGGIIYSFLGATGDKFESFGRFYRKSDSPKVRRIIDHLFQETCGRWYSNLGKIHHLNLTEDYRQLLGFEFDRLEKNRDDLKSVQGKERLLFEDLTRNRKFTNPIQAVRNQSVVKPTYVVTTHGDFNENNIMLDQAGHTWLIDFGMTGQGHILRDVAKLDSVIRFQLLEECQASLEERLTMEEALSSLDHFSEVKELPNRFSTDNPAVAKTFEVASHLIAQAHKLLAQNNHDDIGEYYAALLFNALNTIRFYSLPNTQRQHALLSASLLADRLGLRV